MNVKEIFGFYATTPISTIDDGVFPHLRHSDILISMIEWDFEGQVTFLPPEEGGLPALPQMGYFPSFRYPEFDDRTQFIARPVMGFRPDGTPYDDGEPLDADVTFRFRFLRRDGY